MTANHHPQPEQAILQLLKAAVPERGAEIDDLWRRYRPAIHVSEDAVGVTMDATRHRIRFDNKTLRVLWLLGFNGWHCISLYSPAVVLSGMFGLPIEKILGEDDERGLLELAHRSRQEMATRLLGATRTEDVDWPEDIPEPGSERLELNSEQEKVTFDLVCMATAFVLLHEFHHVMLDADGARPAQRLEEEIACDVWARAFMTDRIGDHVRDRGEPYHDLLQKRAMAMALGASILHDLTPEIARWGSADYPPIADRIHGMVSGIGPAEDSHYWLFASCLLIGLFRRSGRSLPMVASDQKRLVTDLIDQLR